MPLKVLRRPNERVPGSGTRVGGGRRTAVPVHEDPAAVRRKLETEFRGGKQRVREALLEKLARYTVNHPDSRAFARELRDIFRLAYREEL